MITCGFVGLGLIGGSIARALKANRKDIVIIACDPNEETLKLATEQKIADEAYPAPCDAFTACDYIFLCAPVSHNDENLLKILSYRKKDCILTDVGSVKTPINSLIHSLGLTDCFIGGHPMAAGLSLPEENVDKFREKINACANLTEDDLIPKIKIDIPMPAAYADAGLIREFAVLEPFGKANIKPQFADKNLSITKAFVVGKNQNVLRLNLVTAAGEAVSAVYFGDIEAFKAYYAEKYGSAEVEKAFRGQINKLRIMIVYYPEINEYNGVESVQVIIRNYQ